MRPRNFRMAVRYRLVVNVLEEETPCPLCADHYCIWRFAKSGDLITRHNSLRNLLDNFASVGGLSPILEKKGILGHSSGRRPGDVTIMNWSEGKGLAIDVAVTSPDPRGEPLRRVRCSQQTRQVRR